MALSAAEAIIGPAYVEFGGVDLGLTTEDGVTLSPEFETATLRSAQSILDLRKARTAARLMVTATFQQLTLEKLKLLLDSKSAVAGSTLTLDFQSALNERTLVLTMPGSNGSTRVLTATATVESTGEMAFGNQDFTGCQVVFHLKGDATTDSFGSIVETAGSATVPAPASYKTVDSGGSETALVDTDTGVAIDEDFLITFNVAIRPDQIDDAHFILKTAAGNTAVSATIAAQTVSGAKDYTKVLISPAANLSNSTEYELIVVKGTKSVSGVGSTALAAIQFTTAAP